MVAAVTLRRLARDHHDRKRPQPHDLFQKLEPIHLGHLDVEGHHVRNERLDRLARLHGVRRLADDRDVGVLRQGQANEAAHGCGIIDDKHADGFQVGLAVS